MPLRLKSFLEQIVDLMQEDFPRHLAKMVREADGVTYLQHLDKESAVIVVRNNRIEIKSRVNKRKINIRVYITRRCFFDVLEGKRTLAEALESGELSVFGDPSTMLTCYAVWERIISLARTSPRFYFLTYCLK